MLEILAASLKDLDPTKRAVAISQLISAASDSSHDLMDLFSGITLFTTTNIQQYNIEHGKVGELRWNAFKQTLEEMHKKAHEESIMNESAPRS